MIDWQDTGIVLARRAHGEDAAVVQILTRDHGRYAGLVRGAQSRRGRALYEPGTIVDAEWRARLTEHLGQFHCEPIAYTSANLLNSPKRLSALASAMAVLAEALPEREPHPSVFDGTHGLFTALEGDYWAEAYVQWETLLLGELGFALDLSGCAGGGNDRLAYVSPRTGRAVSLSAGEPYRDRLLRLPGFLIGESDSGPEDVAAGLSLTAYFLSRHVLAPADRALPAARVRFAERFEPGRARNESTTDDTPPSTP